MTFIPHSRIIIITCRIGICDGIVSLSVTADLIGIGKPIATYIICGRIPVSVVICAVKFILVYLAILIVIAVSLVRLPDGITYRRLPEMLARQMSILGQEFLPRVVPIVTLVD